LPVLSVIKEKAKISQAKVEMVNLKVAINAYAAEYNRMPASKEAEESVNASCPDFTFGTMASSGSLIASTSVTSTGNTGYQNCNAEVLAILTDNANLDPNKGHARNPRQHVFFNARPASGNNSPGLGSDGALRDPWGNPYIITVDMDGDNICQDGFYYPLTKGSKPLLLHDSVMIWSFGPDGKADPSRSVGVKGGANKDNVLSWE